MINKKTKLALGVASATIAMAGALVAPQAVAETKAEKVAAAMDKKVEAMELQIQEMANMMDAMQTELTRVKTETAAVGNNDHRFMELENWMASVKNTPAEVRTKDNMVFFRGGWAKNLHRRNGVSIASTTHLGSGAFAGSPGGIGDSEGWYIGAGFDWSINDNLFGLMDNTEFLAEIQLQYKDLGTTHSNLLAANRGLNSNRLVTVSSVNVTASPKIKFMKGSKFRPWIIPIGLSLNVISPPSESITVLAPGMVFAAGADYQIWDDVYLGIDGRYNEVADQDGVDQDGFEVGAYVGFGF